MSVHGVEMKSGKFQFGKANSGLAARCVAVSRLRTESRRCRSVYRPVPRLNLQFRLAAWVSLLYLLTLLTACGTNGSRRATDQLLMSDAVDQTVSQIDFRALRGKKVFLDTQYLRHIKGFDYVNSEYIISSLRQQMFAAGCLVQDSEKEADFVAEARVGALGTDSHDLVYGIPASNALSTAATLMPNAPPLPAIPEISFARKDEKQGAAKVAVFVYHRNTRQPFWQSGIAQARSTSKDRWILGAGPFQSGSIYKEAQFAGNEVELSGLVPWAKKEDEKKPVVPIDQEVHFQNLQPIADEEVELASFEDSVEDAEEPPQPEKKASTASDSSQSAD